ncbi:unnamed protein product [Gadus morhua 'NCC']
MWMKVLKLGDGIETHRYKTCIEQRMLPCRAWGCGRLSLVPNDRHQHMGVRRRPPAVSQRPQHVHARRQRRPIKHRGPAGPTHGLISMPDARRWITQRDHWRREKTLGRTVSCELQSPPLAPLNPLSLCPGAPRQTAGPSGQGRAGPAGRER